MQRGRVLNLSKLKITSFLFQNKILIICFFVFIFGVIFGISSVGKYESLTEFTKNTLNQFINLRTSENFLKIFLNSLFNSVLILLMFSILGTSMYGVVTVPLVVCFLGVIYGNITAFLYSEYALKGIAFNAVVFLPASIIFIIIILLSCKEAVDFSIKISSLTFSKSFTINLSLEFKRFLVMFLIFIAGVILSALIDATVSCGLIKYFKF